MVEKQWVGMLIVASAIGVMRAADAQMPPLTLQRGADPHTVVMSSENGPVGVHLVDNDRIVACQYAPNRAPSSGSARSKFIVVFDLKSGRELNRIAFANQFPVKFTACSADGRYLIVSGQEKAQQLDLKQGVVVRSWPLQRPFSLPVVSPDSQTLALCDDRVISLIDLSSGKLINRLPAHPARIRTASFDEQGDSLLSSCGELTRRWDLASAKSKNFSVHEQFSGLAMDPTGARLFGTYQASDRSGGAVCYDLRSGRRTALLPNQFSMATDFDANRWYTINGYGGTAIDAVQVRQLSNPDAVKYLPFDDRLVRLTSRKPHLSVDQLSLSPDKRYLMARFSYGDFCQVWKLDSQTEQKLLSSASHLQHRHVPSQPTSKPKTREQQFLDEIWGIRDKVSELKEKGQPGQAVKEIESLLAAGERRLQKAPRRHQLLIENCGQAYKDVLGERAKGHALIVRALAMAESAKRFDKQWEGLINQVSSEQCVMGDRVAGANTYRRIIDYRESNGLSVSSSDYSRLGQLVFDPKNPRASREPLELFHKAWQRSKAENGTLDIRTRANYDRLVTHVKMVGGWASLQPVLEEQLREYERFKGPGHPETAEAALQLAQLYERLDQPSEALAMMDRSQRVLRDHVARVLPSMSEDEQRAFLTSHFQPSLNAAFAMAVRLKAQPNAAKLSAGWILNAKGTATRATADRARVAASTKDPEVKAIATELAEIRERLSSLSLAAIQVADPANSQESGAEDRQRELLALRQRESDLSWKLGLAGWTELRQDPWTPVQAIRDLIPDGSVLIELTVIGLYERRVEDSIPNFGRRSAIGLEIGKPKVVAWIIPPAGKGDVRMGVLCEDLSDLARPLLHFHACVSGQLGGNQLGAVSRQFLAEIAEHLVHRMPPEVLAAKRWLISPDHLLWIVPWAALPESADRLVVERHEVQYVLSGRDLLTLPTTESRSVPLIVANPNYGSGSSGTSQDIAFVPLPGTLKEAQGVLPCLRRLGGAEPNVFVGPKAEESVVKAAKRPKVALFSTHGFAGVSPDQHPMATCGLALTNANAAIEGNGDGVLTGLEILASDYRGTELVVLSACQTALGDISSGEGVASLRYAFQLAGARNVAGTLWSIPDAITAEMMSDFFKHYSAGQTPAAALRIAQLATIRRLESQGEIADPALWAAFTIAGPPATENTPTENTPTGSIKTWRSANAKHTIDAELISVEGQRVVLRKLDGAEIQVPLAQLHQDDREKIARATGQRMAN